MTPPAPFTTTMLRCRTPHIEACPCPSRVFTFPMRVLTFRAGSFSSSEFEAVFSPGDPISVAFSVPTRAALRVVAESVPFPSRLAWNGIPARLVQIRIGLPILGSLQPRPFRLLALLPLRRVEGVPHYLRLGAQFLHAYRAEARLSAEPCEGRLIIPT